MEKYHLSYLGDLRVKCLHANGTIVVTDAPKDNQGKGELFSPTDLLAVSLGSCMLTIMAIAAKPMGIDLKGMTVEVEKEMSVKEHRRIGRIAVHFHCPKRFSEDIEKKLEKAVLRCPVHESLHPDIKQEFDFVWG